MTSTRPPLEQIVVATLAALLVAAAGGGADAVAAETAAPAVAISDRLEPASVTVPAGGTVTWRNAHDERHRVRSTSGPDEFDSGNLDPSETWTETFSVPGEYRYVDARDDDDQAHWGTVTVTARPGGQTPPSAPAPSGAGIAADDAGSGQAAVSLIDRSFSPTSVEVPAGATVTWSNESDRDHTVTADDGSFDSGQMPPGSRFAHTFERPGSFGYFCAFHGGMRGTVVVTAADSGGAETAAVQSPSAPTDPAVVEATPSAAATGGGTGAGQSPSSAPSAGLDAERRLAAVQPVASGRAVPVAVLVAALVLSAAVLVAGWRIERSLRDVAGR